MHLRFSTILLFVLSLRLVVAAAELSAGNPQALVRQLGDADFQTRVAAERRLLQLGAESLPAVDQGTQSDDPEIRLRALRLMEMLQRLSFSESRDQLRTNPWTVSADVAPAWEVYHALAGDSAEARELYVEMLQQETDLLLAVQRSPDHWPLSFERRCADIQTFTARRRSERQFPPASTAALLFLAVHPENSPSSRAVSVVNMLIDDSQFIHTAEHAPSGPVIKSLLSHWIVSDRNSTPQKRLSLAARFNLPAGIEPARELIESRNATGQSRTQLQNAILFLARYGGHNVIGELDQLLDDDTSLWPARSRSASQKDLQIRDVALLGLLTITDQNPADYGFEGTRKDSNYVFAANSSSFPDQAAREAAFNRWADWRARHLRNAALDVEDASEWWQL
jgi:hypothetical protein